MRRAVPIGGLLLAFVPGAAAADTTATGASVETPTWEERVVVTASRAEERIPDAPASVIVLTRQDIRHSAALTLDDVLRQVPGFSLFRRAGSLVAHPTTQGVSLRGIGPSGTSRAIVLLDGIPMNDPFGGWISWSRIPIDSIERIEIVRGGGSGVWGNAALGGVINIVTMRPEGRSLDLSVEAGTKDTRSLRTMAQGTLGAAAASFEASLFDTAGYSVVRSDQRGRIDIPADSRHASLHAKVEHRLSERASLTSQAVYFSEDRGGGSPLSRNATDSLMVGVGAAGTTPEGSAWQLSVSSQRQTFESSFSSQATDRNTESPALDQFDVPSRSIEASLEWSKAITAGHLLGAGADVRRVNGETHEDFRFLAGEFTRRRRAGGTQRIAGFYVQWSLYPASSWQVTLGGRLDAWRSGAAFRTERDLQSSAELRNDRFAPRSRSLFSPRAALLFRATDGIRLRGSLYKGFRAPTINELHRPFRVRNDITEANANLRPERMAGADGGIDWSTPSVVVRATAFWNELRDPIVNISVGEGPGSVEPCGFVPAGGTCRQRRNLERTRVRGIEADVEYAPREAWRLSAGYLWSDAKVSRAPQQPELEGRTTAQVPAHLLVLRAVWSRRDRASASLQARYVGEQFEDDLNSLALEPFVTLDLAGSVRLGPRLEAFLGIENVLDRTYEVGRSADGTVTTGQPLLVHGGFRMRWAPLPGPATARYKSRPMSARARH